MSVTPFKLPVVPALKRQSYLNLYKRGVREDGRSIRAPRQLEIKVGVLEKAEGSALVRLGNTQVLAGVKVEATSPFKDTPNQGVLVVHAENVPLASPMFEPGPPDENAIELARVIDRSLREVRAVDLEALVLRPGEKVWNVWVDVYVLDHDGNLFDASMLATMAALLSTELPDFEELETGEVVVKRGTKGRRLKVDHSVVTVTTAKVGNYIIVDPNFEEEVISDYRLVLSFDENLRIVGAQKTGSGGMRAEELQEAIKVSKEASQIYFKALEQVRGGGK
ncbi:MAG: exosome complex protein Rrp42 [Acidilobaceae archaeon]|nr:exosome complex protein Rrp42 [Acidilobaceae archaeon]MDW7974332.1 exosome complex protein Rrp42 [Sulfolobales archaeon]